MPIATSTPSSAPRPPFGKMEDRKRPAGAGGVDELAPPSKRQAVNGTTRAKDDGGDSKEEAWIEEYQKGAIYRQMLEYKRQSATLENRLEDMEKKASDFSDYARLMDAWWLQLVQEVELLINGIVTSPDTSLDSTLSTGLYFKDSKDFQKHLGDKSNSIRTRIDQLLQALAGTRGEVKSEVGVLETQLKMALAKQKECLIEIDRLKVENQTLSEQYNTATLRYVKAEKKLDRVKSAQVQKLEQQALANATRPSGAEHNGGDAGPDNGNLEELRVKCSEADAAVSKYKEQVESLLAEVKSLQDENSTYKARKDSISDEDYAKTEIFKQFKNQNEDLIKRLNTLEATNKQLREDAKKMEAERTSFRESLEQEAQAATVDLEDQVRLKEQDLTRIRSARDELFAELTMRKNTQEQERNALKRMEELVSAKDDRITSLELELERLRPSEDAIMSDARAELDALSLEELRDRYLKLEKDFESINKELPALQLAYKKAQGMAQKKVMDLSAMEERIAILMAEKSKADQKYFAARKDMDVRNGEIRALRLQSNKSSEIISQQKDEEAKMRALLANLEKQLADLKQANSSLAAESKKMEASSADATRRADSIKAQVADLSSQIKSKDTSTVTAREKAMAADVELEKVKTRLDHVQKDRDTWKNKCLSNTTSEEQMLRHLALCTVCRSNFKNTILKTCGHLFCNGCVEDRIANRMRKCPICSKAFDKNDVSAAHL